MKRDGSLLRRAVSLVETLPEVCRNDVRFGVPFVLPRWFRMPRRVRVAGRWIPIEFPDEEGVDAELLACMLRNVYGLGRGLGRKPDGVRTIVDVGANLGFFSLAAQGFYPHAEIHAYEPNARIVPMLRANAANLNIQVFAEALGGAASTVTLRDDGPSNRARVVPETTEGVPVSQVTLETAVERMGGAVELLKLNCEGAEWGILQPGPWWRAVKNLRMEYHLFGGETAEQAKEMVEALGFRVTRLRQTGDDGGILWAARR